MNLISKIFTPRQIVISWIFGTMILSSLMILYNNMKLKKDICSSIFLFTMTVVGLVFNIHQDDNIVSFVIFNQLSSIMTVLLVIPIKKDMNRSIKIEIFPKFSNIFTFNMNSFFIFSLYSSIYFIFYK